MKKLLLPEQCATPSGGRQIGEVYAWTGSLLRLFSFSFRLFLLGSPATVDNGQEDEDSRAEEEHAFSRDFKHSKFSNIKSGLGLNSG